MKKTLFLLLCVGLVAACASAPKRPGINAVPETVTKAITKADRSCTVDADCVAVQKGCCMCAGYEAVNAESAQKVQKAWNKACIPAACTREMCYVQITPLCQDGVCVGKPKPMDSYFGR